MMPVIVIRIDKDLLTLNIGVCIVSYAADNKLIGGLKEKSIDDYGSKAYRYIDPITYGIK